uniref:LOW QUALITY PROTEIN: LEAF RUST 10 DISEASE-RESISTANCE LOCUS RECEPTOR-LIKE PROTEIN KINASE-like 2.1 n=1 Tax=Elaeis guineensis var. tenera TaxID=51953 RepID=A0A8N4IAG5_ELAGV|nr:LOW QUALITY PROTEIN: LEAF RUST 10 DISEASE-RESISTANCE LOCUS RECEPTOR-LIKE PROTEIN KINASE-like 2.1 [Elaeis guineensis]
MTDAKSRNDLIDIYRSPPHYGIESLAFVQPIYQVSTMRCRIFSSPSPVHMSLVFLLLFISINGYPANSPPASFCPNSTTCGGQLTAYPFWVNQNPSYYCGYEGFMLICKDGHPILSLGSHEYNVTNIDYHNQTISLVDTDVVDAGTCPWPRHNLTFEHNSFLNYTSSDIDLTFFLNCSLEKDLSNNQITCLPGSDASNSSYIFTDDDLPTAKEYGLAQRCQGIVVAPVLNELSVNGSHLLGDFGGVLKKGFQLHWSGEPLGECGRCELSGGRCGYNQTGSTGWVFVRFCSDSTGTHKLKKRKIMIGTFVALAGLSLWCLFLLAYLLRYRKSHPENVHSVEDLLRKYGSLVPKRYKYSEIKRMTKSFSHKLGQGGYGNVFKGSLYDGSPVAVKVLSESKGNGEEFVNEVVSIGKTSHVNIVCLLGFCIEGSKRALVYEFMPNGSLEKFIYTEIPNANIKLGWEKLYEITVGVARGLEYLHRGCNTRIVHFDIKPHNILLDQDFCPKISDFGLAKLCPPKESIISINGARGTVGYIAPEVFSRNFGVISSKSDVYSYGMMVLEMVGGRKNIDARVENTSEIYFPHWIFDHLDQYNTLEACRVTSETEEIVKKMIIVGLWCIQMQPTDRPSMSRVVDMLEGSISDLQMPPKP